MSELESLKKLREPFQKDQILKLPKPTKAQNDCPQNDKINCKECGGFHHKHVIHLDYVGHAALTNRLLDVDPLWHWDFMAIDANGLPVIDKDGGMWIKLTVCGMTRYGYGDAQGKTGGNAMKERVGDALRNAAMRFGAALDLWHKGDALLFDEPKNNDAKTDISDIINKEDDFKSKIMSCDTFRSFLDTWEAGDPDLKQNSTIHTFYRSKYKTFSKMLRIEGCNTQYELSKHLTGVLTQEEQDAYNEKLDFINGIQKRDI